MVFPEVVISGMLSIGWRSYLEVLGLAYIVHRHNRKKHSVVLQ